MLLTRDAEKRPNAEELLRRRWARMGQFSVHGEMAVFMVIYDL